MAVNGPMKAQPARDYPSDSPKTTHQCLACNQPFLGGADRAVCRDCARPLPDDGRVTSLPTPEEIAGLARSLRVPASKSIHSCGIGRRKLAETAQMLERLALQNERLRKTCEGLMRELPPPVSPVPPPRFLPRPPYNRRKDD